MPTKDVINDIINDLDIDGGIPPVEIDTEGLNAESIALAQSIVDNFCKDESTIELLNVQPKLKKQIDAAIESLRLLIKMRKADEITHDMIVKAIGQNCTNASLYGALSRQQTQLINIQKQMDDTISKLQALLKSYQLELNFSQPNNSSDFDMTNVNNSTKDLLKQIEQEEKEQNGEKEPF